ncbi:hypothetical protein PGT21_004988 [Puccinia graminis f. sp. tritici]|uniref:Uncharacterized protein n=1 Tax=Puccinia graminis f. sp. tritici TaxID=56615 RepID=A0A5B0PIL0_PUCGR|nr:hypothetical protein PGT21_004988 [Puccinia graminis f. sp. tritici]
MARPLTPYVARVLRALSIADMKLYKPGTRLPSSNTQALPARPLLRPYNSFNRENGHPFAPHPPPAPHPKSDGLHSGRHWGMSLTPSGDDEGRTYG